MGCDSFESIEPYRLTAVTPATMSVHLGSLGVSLICSIWQQTSSCHVVRQRVHRRKWRQDVVCQWVAAESKGDRQWWGGGYKERQAKIKQKKNDTILQTRANPALVLIVNMCPLWFSEPLAATEWKQSFWHFLCCPTLCVSSVVGSASASGIIWLVSTGRALTVAEPARIWSSFS